MGTFTGSEHPGITPNGHRVTLPVSAYLIEHPAGLYLVDTGWSKDPDLPRHLTADDPDCVKVLCSHDPGVVHGATYEL